jgi:outer membrane receptor protein involved in Fe transport
MVNGVDINDNQFAQPQNLFVEDAIQETQVLTAGISAEYGRFSGGVINAITKSGGNTFSGSGRINFLNPSWTTATPFEVSRGAADAAHPDTLQHSLEGTFGGPLLRDKLWFFTSGRYQSIDNTVTLAQTGAVLPTNDNNKRGEIKLTGTVAQKHTIQGGYLNDPRKRTNNSGIQTAIIDPHSEVNRENPNWYTFFNYKGVFRNSLVEGQFSERKFSFQNDGGTDTNLVTGSPFRCLSITCVYNAPYFDATDPTERNNRQLTGNVTSFWNAHGRHDTKAGYEYFRGQEVGGNSQSPTSYVFFSDFLPDAGGRPVLDSTGRPVPMFVPGETFIVNFRAVRGAAINIDTQSLFVQDHWAINNHWSTDLGARFEHVKALSTGNITSVSTNRIMPRLGTSYDLFGNGDHIVHFTYGQYGGRYNQRMIGRNSPVSNPVEIDATYLGPAGQGYDFAPGFNLANYPVNSANASVDDPTQNVFINPDTTTPITHEVTTSYGVNLFNGRGYAEATYIYRKTKNFIEDFITVAGGTTEIVVDGISAGRFTNINYSNSNLPQRGYQAMTFQSRYRISNRWNFAGHYTVQLKNDGNYEGEATNQPGNTSSIGDYPEAFNATRTYPTGRLQDFQRHRLRIWSIYDVGLGRAGDVSVAGLWRVDSGLVFSLASLRQPLTATQRGILTSAGYPNTPQTQTVFYADRGSEMFKGYGLFDLDLSYNVPVFKSLRPWIKFDVYNLFNNQKLIAWNTTVSQTASSARDNLGLATAYTRGSTFGTATGNTVTNLNFTGINAYPLAFNGSLPGGRTYRVAVGFRF